jgi:hypothetical protein
VTCSDLYPEIEPYDHGLLGVGDGNSIHWEDGTLLRDAAELEVVADAGHSPGESLSRELVRATDQFRAVF